MTNELSDVQLTIFCICFAVLFIKKTLWEKLLLLNKVLTK